VIASALGLGVAVRSACKSDVSEGDWLRSVQRSCHIALSVCLNESVSLWFCGRGLCAILELSDVEGGGMTCP
jgi:hypothetical protein